MIRRLQDVDVLSKMSEVLKIVKICTCKLYVLIGKVMKIPQKSMRSTTGMNSFDYPFKKKIKIQRS